MAKHIDKSALVAEIERLKADALQKKSQCKRSGLERIMHQIGAYNKILSFLDTLEVKEVQEERISESFQEWEKRYLEEHQDEIINVYDRHAGLIDGAIWQAFHITKNAIEREVKVDAGGYPYIDATELYDYTEDKPLAKAGDKVKLIIIKGE